MANYTRLVRDVRRALAKGDNVSISILNYGLDHVDPKDLASNLPGVAISGPTFLGYYTFRKGTDR